MSSTAVAHLLPPVLTIAFSMIVGIWLWRTRRDVRGVSLYLLLILVGGIVWQAQLVALVLTTEWSLAKFLVVSEKFTGFLASFVWVFFVSQYTDHDLHRRRWVQALVGVVVVGYPLLAITNGGHHLLFVDIVRYEEPFFHGSAVRGPVYYLFLVITYAFVLGSIASFASFIAQMRQGARSRTTLLVVGAVAVGIANSSSVLGLGPVSTFQYGGYGAFPFIIATTVGVFGMGLLTLAPVARTTLVETLPDAVIVVDGDTRVVDYNRAALSLWPTLRTSEGEPLTEATPELAARVDLPESGTASSDITLTVDGETRYFSLLVSLVQRDHDRPGPLGYSLLLRDVTELEESRKRLESKNQRLDQVAATISHDLRNPLAVAEGNVALAAENVDDPDVAPHLQTVREAHERMGNMIEDVLVLARRDAEGVEMVSLSLDAVASEAWDHVETGEATLDVRTNASINADRGLLLTIFENLFRNSVEHGPPAVTVTVESIDGGFAVGDDGPGIPQEEAADIFQQGYSTSSKGAGLGLAIVRTFAETQGWAVEVDPTADGARFRFSGVERVS